VASVSLVLFIYLWPVLNIVFAGSLAFPTSPEAKAVVCSYDECDTSDFAALQAAAREPDADSGLKYALALARLRLAGMSAEGHLGVDERASDRRCSSAELAALDARLQRGQLGESGPQVLLSARQWVGVHCVDNLEEAAALLSDLSDKRGSPRLKSGVNVALGNARFIDGMRRCMASGNVAMGSELFERAEVHYDLALKADPRSWEALFDKAKVLLVKGDYSASREHTSKAAALHPEAVAAMEKRSQLSEDTPCGSVFNANRELAVVPPAFPAISRLGSGPQDAQEVRAQLPAAHALLVGPLEPWTLVALSTAALLLFALLSFTRRHLKPSSRCIKCGDISCVRCRPELAGTGLCDRCVYYKIRSSYDDPKETWLREKRIEHRFRVRQRLEALLTFLLPGAGHLLRGRPLRGGLFLFAFACALGVILFSPAVAAFASLQTGVTAGSAVGTVFWSVLAFLVYFLSLLDVYSWR
jgi:tetratricopeptide (TPR) repeat protein